MTEEGSLAGVAERSDRLAELAERRAELAPPGLSDAEIQDFQKRCDDEAVLWREMVRLARIPELRLAKELWPRIDQGCKDCHSVYRKERS
ncbi:MAG: hypothetical protein HY720_16665 [Planctomycetes bacterium]|nr:hypothetical protein [Planctomycetota bacterium]